ncbi:S49 family peptidase [Legionella israelensis]|uniref:S49 family peptidase n=1 Tax=Legionella israelensis TaxID=454 RepID=A0AAX1EGZ7_9GAMM|nr:S49 family peptidase [Legionella israelensis]QBR84307.1 S49 family peptidase [Legionella israelensis]
MNNESSSNDKQDSQALLNTMILEYMREQRRKRRWRWLFRIFILLFIIFLFFKINQINMDDKTATILKPHAGLIDLTGTIFEGRSASSDNLVKALDNAYQNKNMKGLILRINSPGGSPVQAEYMYNSIRYYQQKYPDIKIYAVCVDACLSAGYYVASAADEIYASPVSLVGSIGVVYNGFGFVDTIDKLGMTRRLQTAGMNKAFLDPFSPEKPKDKQYLQTMLDLIHQQFISRVKEGRKSRLHIDSDTFSGLFWTGEQSLGQGLIDGFGSSGDVARVKINVDDIIDYTYTPSLFERFAKNVGTAMANELPSALGIKQGIS